MTDPLNQLAHALAGKMVKALDACERNNRMKLGERITLVIRRTTMVNVEVSFSTYSPAHPVAVEDPVTDEEWDKLLADPRLTEKAILHLKVIRKGWGRATSRQLLEVQVAKRRTRLADPYNPTFINTQFNRAGLAYRVIHSNNSHRHSHEATWDLVRTSGDQQKEEQTT